MRPILRLIAVFCLISLLPIAPVAHGHPSSSPWVTGSSVEADHVTLTLRAGDYRVTDGCAGQRVEVEGFSYLMTPGEPMLPAKTFLVALPPGAGVQSVKTQVMASIQLPGTYRIEPSPPIVPVADACGYRELVERLSREWQSANEAAYSSDDAYPNAIARLTGTGTLRKYAYASISFCPFRYHPRSGSLVHVREARIVLNYRLPPPGSPEAREVDELKWDTLGDIRASRLFVNYDEIRPLYEPEGAGPEDRTGDYDYVIITTSTLEGTVSSSDFPGWKAVMGHGIRTVLTTDAEISTQPGRDLAEQIRNFLRSYYGPWDIEHVLIVGDYATVPMRYCYPDPYNHQHNPSDPLAYGGSVPTDYYYADLSLPDAESWDSDGDGYPGEYTEDDPDFLAEVYVGRIPTSDPARVTYSLNKLVRFEQDMGDWKSRALHAGSIPFYENQDYSGYPKVDFADYMNSIETDIMSGWTISHYSEQAGLDPSEYPWPALTQAAFTSDWQSGQYGVVNWGGHGWPCGGVRTVWAWDDGDGVPESANGELQSPAIVACTDVFEDDYPSIVFAVGCKIGYPEPNPQGNIAVDLLTDPARGASAGVISASRSAAASAGGPESPGGVQSLCYEFNRFMINGPEGPERIGNALYDSKHYCHENFAWDHFYEFKNLFGHNLYGDPALARQGYPTAAEADIPRDPCGPLRLDQNHPNPFNPLTEITYAIPFATAPSRVTIEVYDCLGRSVTTLVDAYEGSGTHRATWDGTDRRGAPVSSGVYFYRIAWDGRSQTRRMVLVK